MPWLLFHFGRICLCCLHEPVRTGAKENTETEPQKRPVPEQEPSYAMLTFHHWPLTALVQTLDYKHYLSLIKVSASTAFGVFGIQHGRLGKRNSWQF